MEESSVRTIIPKRRWTLLAESAPIRSANRFVSGLLVAAILCFAGVLPADPDSSDGRLGIHVEMINGSVRINQLTKNGAGEKAGLRRNDFIRKIGGVSIEGLTVEQLIKQIRGPVGEPVTLVVARGEPAEILSFTVTREPVSEDEARIEKIRKLLASQNYDEALPLVQQGVDNGSAGDQATLGWMYQEGHGVEKNAQQSAYYFTLAANQGLATAQNRLGNFLMTGHGVKRDYAQARKWLEKAAASGDLNASANLGVMYEKGWGVPVDYSESGRWYHMAADGGHEGAKAKLLEFPSINILGSDIHQARLKAGDKVRLNLLWEILRLPSDQTVPVQIERQLFLDGKPLFSTPRIEILHKGTGRHTTEFEFPVPPSAQPGTYVFETTVTGIGSRTKKETVFVIGPP